MCSAQISFSGCLIENINSLGNANHDGYSPTWYTNYVNSRTQKTSGGFHKMDLVGSCCSIPFSPFTTTGTHASTDTPHCAGPSPANLTAPCRSVGIWCFLAVAQVSFTYHHALAPLIDPAALAMEIGIHRVIYGKTWGSGAVDYSKGFFPAEMAFTERAIPTLVAQGIEWVIVPNNHISRACKDYPFSPSGDNNDPPNLADQVRWLDCRVLCAQCVGVLARSPHLESPATVLRAVARCR